MIHSIRWKAGFILALVFSVALLISGIGLNSVVEKSLKTQAVQTAQLQANLAVKQIDERLGYIQQAYSSIAFDKSLEEWLTSGDSLNLKTQLSKKLETLLITSNYNVYSVYIFDLKGKAVYSTELQSWNKADKWDVFEANPQDAFPKLTRQNNLPYSSPKMVSLIGYMRKNFFDEPIAGIAVNVLLYDFNQILSQDFVYDDTMLFVADDDGYLLAQGGKEVNSNVIEKAFAGQSGGEIEVDGKKYILISAKTSKYRLSYYQLIPQSEVYAGAINMRYILAAILVAFSIVVFVLLYKMLHYITNPIYELSDAVRSYRQNGDFKGGWHGSFKTARKDEFAYLYNSLEEMTKRIDMLIDQEYKAQIYKKETQLRVFQNGMNPHFLYNILDSILWTLKFKDYSKAEKMLQDFSSFLHYTLHQSKEYILCSDLQQQLISFCSLSSFLRDDSISCYCDFASNTLNYNIPSFLLQPLVENCFKHAFKGKETGNVWIKASIQKEHLVFMVADDGVGMDLQKTIELKQYLNNYDVNRDKEHFGMASVHQRLKLYYGAQYGVTIDSSPHKGTRSTIMLPLNMLNKE